MLLMISAISIFDKRSRRRKVLESLKEGEKNVDELMAAAGYKSKSHCRALMRGLQKVGYVVREGSHNIAYWKITNKGIGLLSKTSIEEVL